LTKEKKETCCDENDDPVGTQSGICKNGTIFQTSQQMGVYHKVWLKLNGQYDGNENYIIFFLYSIPFKVK